MEKLREIIAGHEQRFMDLTLGPRLQIGLACLKAYEIFLIKDAGKRNKSGKNQHSKPALVTRDEASPGGFEGWLADQVSWLKKPTAYKYMTAVRGLGLDHKASEKQVAAALKLQLRKGPVTLASLCAAAVEAIGPPPEPPQQFQQSEFDFTRSHCVTLRENIESFIAALPDVKKYPDLHKAAQARLYTALVAATGTDWQPSDVPDALADVDPDSITL